MDDVVAAKVRLKDGSSRYFLTWGRIQDAVDPQGVEDILWASLPGFDLGGAPESVHLCQSLQEAADAEFFFEAFLAIARQPIPYGPGYPAWADEKKRRMLEGKDIWYVGAKARLGSIVTAVDSHLLAALLEVLDQRSPNLASSVRRFGLETLSKDEVTAARDALGDELAALDFDHETWEPGTRGSTLEALIDHLNRTLFD